MNYAPVLIPTLNRYDHLKKCLDSLNNNHNADKTEVFISVDYPPSDKYKEGHDKICDYLDNNTFAFKKLHVFKQTENLGVINDGSKKYSNSTFLTYLVCQKYDRWIFTEDDNYFAPGFLDFMNLGLERFKDDNTVYSICGYRFFYDLKFSDNNFFRQQTDFNAWGLGIWKDKWTAVNKIEVGYLRKIVYNPFKVLKIWKISNKQIVHLSALSRKDYFKKGDNFLTLYMIDHGMTQIMPSKSLVRNIGWDGSGLHCVGFDDNIYEKYMSQELDESSTYESLVGTGWECFKENEKVIRNEDFQSCSFLHALNAYIRRIICFWR